MTATQKAGIARKRASAKKSQRKARTAKRGASAGAAMTIGNVTVRVKAPAKREVERNIRSGQFAMKRAMDVISRPGVSLGRRITAIYYADPNEAGRIVREIDGIKDSGIFSISGRFTRNRKR